MLIVGVVNGIVGVAAMLMMSQWSSLAY